jgi:hypothetical protein
VSESLGLVRSICAALEPGDSTFQRRDRLVTHIAPHLSRDRALADLGLEE